MNASAAITIRQMGIGRVSKLSDVRNIADFRELARRRLPFPVFHYIDGGGDDELTKDRNTAAFADVDLVPNVLVGVESVDTAVTVLGKTTALPVMLSPTALQRLFHWQGERAVAAAAEKFGLWFGVSSLASVGMAEIGANYAGPKMLQYYYHKDRGLNAALPSHSGSSESPQLNAGGDAAAAFICSAASRSATVEASSATGTASGAGARLAGRTSGGSTRRSKGKAHRA